MRFLLLLGLLSLTVRGETAAFDHARWDALLRQHVVVLQDGRATQVDYAGMAKDQRRLAAYLAATEGVTPATFEAWDETEQLAFLINVYNARTIELVLTRFPALQSIRDLGFLLQSPWRRKFFRLLGASRSLDEIEHDLIRARHREPRVHFALNCASIGCPALRPEAYQGARLPAQLEAATRQFLGDRSRNRWINGRLELSSIFKWYREDFEQGGSAGGLGAFLAAYADALRIEGPALAALRRGDLPIRFLDYDWRLNRTP